MEPSLLEKAMRMATAAHVGQVRKEGGVPYIAHPAMIALTLTKHGFPEEIVAAGLVHDVIEDTPISAEQLRAELGDTVADIVAAVTNDDSLAWEEKKKKYIETVRSGPEGAKAVATADKIHNAESLLIAHTKLGQDIWKQFSTGKEQKLWFENAMLTMLQETWEDPLVEEYAVLVERMNALA